MMTPAEELTEIKACAEGALSWLSGYTDSFPDGEQRCVAQHDDGVWVFTPVAGSVFATERRVRIRVVVEVLGCCSGCGGEGSTNDAETGGRCWDCRGTGCAHPDPCTETVRPT
jgi:hypothetical protein